MSDPPVRRSLPHRTMTPRERLTYSCLHCVVERRRLSHVIHTIGCALWRQASHHLPCSPPVVQIPRRWHGDVIAIALLGACRDHYCRASVIGASSPLRASLSPSHELDELALCAQLGLEKMDRFFLPLDLPLLADALLCPLAVLEYELDPELRLALERIASGVYAGG